MNDCDKRLVKADGTPIKVLQIIPTLGAGGAETSLIDVSKRIVEAGGESYVISSGGVKVPNLLRHNAKHFEMPVNRKLPWKIRSNAKKLAKYIKENDIDVVHARSRAPAWAAYKACKMTDTPYMTTFHAAYKFKTKLKRYYNSVMAKGEKVIAISDYIKKHILDNYNITEDKLVIVPRWIDENIFSIDNVTSSRMIALSKQWGIPEDKKVIFVPGRLTPIKGQDIVIKALARLKRDDYICVMLEPRNKADKPKYYKSLLKQIKLEGLEGKVKFVSMISDMPAAYRLASVVVQASQVPEGFGRVQIEAGAMGRIVIASRIGAIPETMIDNETGYLFKNDDDAELSEKLTQVLDMPTTKLTIMQTKAHDFVKSKFTAKSVCGKIINTYRDLAK